MGYLSVLAGKTPQEVSQLIQEGPSPARRPYDVRLSGGYAIVRSGGVEARLSITPLVLPDVWYQDTARGVSVAILLANVGGAPAAIVSPENPRVTASMVNLLKNPDFVRRLESAQSKLDVARRCGVSLSDLEAAAGAELLLIERQIGNAMPG